jgi:hypothetical protein
MNDLQLLKKIVELLDWEISERGFGKSVGLRLESINEEDAVVGVSTNKSRERGEHRLAFEIVIDEFQELFPEEEHELKEMLLDQAEREAEAERKESEDIPSQHRPRTVGTHDGA